MGKRIVAIVVGVIIMIIGVQQITSSDVSCGGQRMTSDDRCVVTTDGRTVTENYTVHKAEQEFWGLVAVLAGVGVALGAGLSLYLRHRSERRAQARYEARHLLARDRGWDYTSGEGYRSDPIADRLRPIANQLGDVYPKDIVAGTVGGLRVYIFSYNRLGRWTSRPMTGWAVELPRDVAGFVVGRDGTRLSREDLADVTVVGAGESALAIGGPAVRTRAGMSIPTIWRSQLPATVIDYVRTAELPTWSVRGTGMVANTRANDRRFADEAQIAERLAGLGACLSAASPIG
jgi:hypothetical protein